jgi:hypothetical protein
MIEYLPLVLTGIGIIVSMLYYTNVLRNAHKTQQLQLETRQAALFMSLYETYQSLEFVKTRRDVIELEWNDFDDFWAKYGLNTNNDAWVKWQSQASFFNGVGVLVKKGLIDISLVDELFSNVIHRMWNHMGPIIIEWRNTRKDLYPRTHELLHGFDYLYNTHLEYIKENPELVLPNT